MKQSLVLFKTECTSVGKPALTAGWAHSSDAATPAPVTRRHLWGQIFGLLFFALLALAPAGTVWADTTTEPTVSITRLGGCVVTDSGGLKCWGSNTFVNHLNYPLDISGFTNVVGVTIGGPACVTLADNTIQCKGNYPGDGNFYPSPTTFVQVAGITDAMAVVSGGYSACALLQSGDVKCWSSYDINGDSSPDLAPVSIPGLSADIVEVTVDSDGSNIYCARAATGGIHCLGLTPSNWQLYLLPDSATDIYVKMSMTNRVLCAVTQQGTVRCWTIFDQNNIVERDPFTELFPSYNTDFLSELVVDYAPATDCLLVATGTVYCPGAYGSYAYGGTGTGRDYYYEADPLVSDLEQINFVIPLGLEGNVTALHDRYQSTCADMVDGSVRCWGDMYNNMIFNYAPLALPEVTRAMTFDRTSLTIAKSGPTPNPPVAGQPVQYTIVVTNSSSVTQTNVTVTEMPSAGLTMSDFTSTPAGSCSTTSGKCTLTDPLAPGASASFLATFDVNASAGAIISNTAYVTSTQNLLQLHPSTPPTMVGVTGASSVATTNLKVTKSAAATSAISGTPFDYTITVSNLSGSAATNVRAVDTLPNNVTFNSASAADGGSCTHSSGAVTCSWSSLAGGASTTATINVTPN